VEEVAMKRKTKFSILTVVVALLAIEMTAFVRFRHRAPVSASPRSEVVADMVSSGLGRASRAVRALAAPAKVEDPGFAALVDVAPPASDNPRADAAKETLCGGTVCRPDQFCCGPPACGHCVSALRGPRCPKTCP
jgi:hypothetical protein